MFQCATEPTVVYIHIYALFDCKCFSLVAFLCYLMHHQFPMDVRPGGRPSVYIYIYIYMRMRKGAARLVRANNISLFNAHAHGSTRFHAGLDSGVVNDAADKLDDIYSSGTTIRNTSLIFYSV